MKEKIKVGDKIQDIEDGDCYFEGIVTEVNTFGGVKTYKVTKVIWSGEDFKDDENIGKTIEPIWWYIQKVEI
jgi:hypothetical protein